MKLDTFVKSVITVAALALILVRQNIPGIVLDNIDFVVFLVGVFPWLPSIVRSAKLPGGFEFEFLELKKNQNEQGMKIKDLLVETQDRQQKEINLLRTLLVSSSIPAYGVQHLRNLSSTEPVIYHPSKSLKADLERLLQSGLIERVPGKGIRTIMRSGGDIQEHFSITKFGKDILFALEKINKERSSLEEGDMG